MRVKLNASTLPAPVARKFDGIQLEAKVVKTGGGRYVALHRFPIGRTVIAADTLVVQRGLPFWRSIAVGADIVQEAADRANLKVATNAR